MVLAYAVRVRESTLLQVLLRRFGDTQCSSAAKACAEFSGQVDN